MLTPSPSSSPSACHHELGTWCLPRIVDPNDNHQHGRPSSAYGSVKTGRSVVEDEFLVRVVKVDILRDAGLRVLEAQDADEALDMLRRRPEIIAVLTDVDMPGSLNGFEFAQLVKQGWPELAVLVISGKMEPGPGDLPRGVAFVQKSIRPAALVEHIRALLPAS